MSALAQFRSLLLSVLAAIAIVGGGPGVAAAQDVEGSTASSPVAETLGRTPWYDPAADSLVPVEVESQQDDSIHRDSRWLPKAERIRRPNSSRQSASGGGGGLFGTGLTLGNLVGWGLLASIVIAVAVLLVYLFSKAEIELGGSRSAAAGAAAGSPDEQTIERMKHLPAELRRTDVNMRDEAMRLMRAADYDQAIILLFGHQLLLLDRAGALRLTRGKTNGRYVRETRQTDPQLGERLQSTVAAFERSYFGRHPIAAADFEELWQNNEQLEQAVGQRREAAA